MSDFTLNFAHPWLLLLFIPAAAILIFGMLRVPGKFRNTRNRVVSVVLEAIVFVCAILAISGFTFSYALGNPDNEVILLVDVTDSMEDSAQSRDDYILELIDIGDSDGCTMGIVTFGYTQVYAAPLTTDVKKIYDQYKSAELPDTTATDLAAAVEYAAKLFNNPESAKIVVISDGKETDENVLSSLTYVTSRGTLVESVYIPSKYEADDVQILSVDLPEGSVTKGVPFDITVNLQSNYATNVTLTVTDNGEELTDIEYDGYSSGENIAITRGITSITMRCTLDEKYLNAITITIGGDAEEYISENNEYHLYFYIDNYNKILMFESVPEQSSDLSDALNDYGIAENEGDDPYDITTMTLQVGTEDTLPLSVNDLRQYDLVILNNVSNSDMFNTYFDYLDELGLLYEESEYYSYFYSTTTGEQKGSNDGGLLPRLLNDYVYVYGGGLFTSGGTDAGDNANAYSRADTYGTVLQDMLPVSTINYSQPTGIMFLVDTSGSIGTSLSGIVSGIRGSLTQLSVRDYVGIMTFAGSSGLLLPMTSVADATEIDVALQRLQNDTGAGGTSLQAPLNSAISYLLANKSLYERMHIIIFTDGNINGGISSCVSLAESCATNGITMTCVIVGAYSSNYLEQMAELCAYADGEDEVHYDQTSYTNCKHIYNCSSSGVGSGGIGDCVGHDLQSLKAEETNYRETMISVDSSSYFSALLDGLQYYTYDSDYDVYTIDYTHLYAYVERYYGTTVKSGATLILTGDYAVPLYAQWSYGAGMVGSYMGDLYGGENTTTILSPAEDGSTAGIYFIINVINNLMPGSDISPTGIEATLTGDNYTNRLTVYADLEDGCSVVGDVYDENGDLVLSLNEVTESVSGETLAYVTTALSADNGYARADFVIKTPGVYTVELYVVDAYGEIMYTLGGTEISTTIYKSFAYSAEYENFDAADGEELMNSISTGAGFAITDDEDLELVFDGFITKVYNSVDPRLVLMIIAIALFLLVVAARKFKWKWPHELVRERKKKKAGEYK